MLAHGIRIRNFVKTPIPDYLWSWPIPRIRTLVENLNFGLASTEDIPGNLNSITGLRRPKSGAIQPVTFARC